MKLENLKKYEILNSKQVRVIQGGLNAQSTITGDLSFDVVTNKKDATQPPYNSGTKI
jgi:hypothetical protein